MDYTVKDDNKYKCPLCDEIFNSDISLIDHFNLVHYEIIIDDLKINSDNEDIIDDNTDVENENSYEDDDGYYSDEYYERVYRESEYGEYVCKICSKKFINHERLNEHFLRSHSSYNDTLLLDDNETIGGFPGFNVLQHMNVFHYTDKPEEDTCPICFETYIKNEILTEKLKFNENEYKDDDEVIVNYPIRLHCCDTCMCCKCLKTFIITKNKIICPFCRRNHEIQDTEFITIPNNKYDDQLWVKWRTRHPLDSKT